MPKTKTRFHVLDDEQTQALILSWWSGLCRTPQRLRQHSDLRRCKTAEEALFTQAFHELWTALKDAGKANKEDVLAWAAAAICMSHMRVHCDPAVSRRFGLKSNFDNSQVVSPAQFNSLVSSDSIDSLITRMRRALSLIQCRGNIISVADHILHWNEENKGNMSDDPLGRFATSLAINYQDA